MNTQRLPREDLDHIVGVKGTTSMFIPETKQILYQAPGYPDVRMDQSPADTYANFFDREIKTLTEAWKA